jgi:hypothetical protein
MLKLNEVNPLAVFGLRRLEHCPPYFTVVAFNLTSNEKKISDWVWENLTGRFYLGDHYGTGDSGKIEIQKVAAFEQPGEASYFSLILDTINKQDSDW